VRRAGQLEPSRWPIHAGTEPHQFAPTRRRERTSSYVAASETALRKAPAGVRPLSIRLPPDRSLRDDSFSGASIL